MRSRPIIFAAGFLAVMALLAAGVVGYDRFRTKTIASGVQVAGVDLGGLTQGQARARIERVVVARIQRRIVVRHRVQRWTLGAREARTAIDVDAIVDEALRRSDEGGLLARSYRALAGGRVDAEVPLTVDYSDDAITRLLVRVRKGVNRDPVDARVRFLRQGLRTQPSRDGLAVDTDALRAQVRAAIVSPTASRMFIARTRQIEPEVTTEELAERTPAAIIVDRSRFKLTLYKHLERAEVYSIAVGQAGLETPAGLYKIQDKAKNPAWHVPDSDWAGELAGKVIPPDDPKNPIKARWMGIYDGAGIHGTDAVDSIGTAASHGCIRMRISDVEKLYEEVPVGAPVFIT